MPGTIVLIDPDTYIANLLISILNQEGYLIFVAQKGTKGLELIRQVSPDLVILEAVLPDLDGLTVCKHLRSSQQTGSTAIILLSAKSEEDDRVTGLEMGADDYVVKPFSPKELAARVNAVLRRYGKCNSNDVEDKEIPELLKIGEIQMDLRQYLVMVQGKKIELTPMEFQLLKTFLTSPGRVFTREYLLEYIWGYEYLGDTRTIDVHIRRLRQRIEIKPDTPVYLKTVRGIGYRFNKPPVVVDFSLR